MPRRRSNDRAMTTTTASAVPPESVWFVIPAYNEGPVIAEVVAHVVAEFPNVIVVDDHSRDESGALARGAGAHVVRHPINLGQGAALQTGIEYALEHGASYLVTFDADGQHRLEDARAMLAQLVATGSDVVVGSRFIGSAENMPGLRRLVLRAAVVFTRLTSGVRLTDAHNGLRVFTRAAAARLHLTQNRMAHASEIVDQFGELGFKVAEAPVTIIYTDYSLAKGQKLGNAVNILLELLVRRIAR